MAFSIDGHGPHRLGTGERDGGYESSCGGEFCQVYVYCGHTIVRVLDKRRTTGVASARNVNVAAYRIESSRLDRVAETTAKVTRINPGIFCPHKRLREVNQKDE